MKKNSIIFRVIAHLCLLPICLCLINPATASSANGGKRNNHSSALHTPPAPACQRPLRIAINPQSPALTVNSQNQVSGILSDFFGSIESASSCRFTWDLVPRARAMHYLKNGLTDIVFAIHSEERDRYGEFIPLIEFHPSLIVRNEVNLNEDPSRILESEQLRFGFVKGYDFGKEYLELVYRVKTAKRGEEIIEVDEVARKMDQGHINASIMSATVFVQPARDILLDQKIQAIPLKQFPKARVGLYLSNQTIKPDERRYLREMMSNKTQIDLFYRLFKTNYPAWAMKAMAPANPNAGN
ncbi:hypothetical protein RF679_04235 [Undibacterium cyanobacteriorum]|uniref:Solute-binding protein family 3/N-terminal domain-containing protein n=1 Tax=Undibacterium cyanobacteriorum TaxID=3073561 RepID=A0ABY9RKW5_9BURK|nr:hypothetical protein [Undibacterium sp. 20NA77.5]WMW81493.1 hypothetical protein RF679_04235 [Undibacterium sp. 20NA77.5]